LKEKFGPTMVSHLVMVVGLCTSDPKDFWNLEVRSWLIADQTRDSRFATCYQCFCAGFGFTELTTTLQQSIYSFTAVYGFIAVTCKLVVTFGDAHWAELIRPQRWAGVRAW